MQPRPTRAGSYRAGRGQDRVIYGIIECSRQKADLTEFI